MLELLLGQIPEAIYFALFMIFAKNIKEKRILFIVLMIIEYLLLKTFIKFNIWFQICYTFLTFIILKMLYGNKSQVTDIFTFTIASIILIIISIISFIICQDNMIFGSIINRILLFIPLFILNYKLCYIQNLYKKLEMKMYRIVYGDKLTLEKAEEIVKDMKPYGEHWTYKQTTDVLKTKGISNIDPVDFYAIMNMSYNDYHDMFDEDIDKYVEYTKLFIDDEDAKEGKVFIYLTTIPKE